MLMTVCVVFVTDTVSLCLTDWNKKQWRYFGQIETPCLIAFLAGSNTLCHCIFEILKHLVPMHFWHVETRLFSGRLKHLLYIHFGRFKHETIKTFWADSNSLFDGIFGRFNYLVSLCFWNVETPCSRAFFETLKHVCFSADWNTRK